MNFKFPDTIIRYRHARNVHAELRDTLSRGDTEHAFASVSSEAEAVIHANQKLMQDSDPASFVKSFEQAVNEAPVFGIILATYPHDTFLTELGAWFRREIHANSLLKINVRRSIAGGIIVQSKNRMFDLSFRPQILESRDRVPEVVRNV